MILYLKAFLAKNLLLLHGGSFLIKIKSATLLSLPLGMATWCINQMTNWTISNKEYITGVMVCIAIDHIVGSFYHAFKKRDFTIKRNAIGLTTKLALTAGSAILFEIIHNTVRDAPLVYEYLKITTRLIVVLYPAGSAMMNMSALTNGAFPPLGWIKKIKAFNQDLDLDKFKSKNDNSNSE